MTDLNLTPIPAALERDALTAGLIDSSPLGGVLTDGTFKVIHVSTVATRLLGCKADSGGLGELVRQSRVLRPDLFETFLNGLGLADSTLRSYHVVESESGEPRCIAIEAAQCQRWESRWVFWLEDVTAKSHLRQFQLLAEIGRSRATEASTASLADSLVDALVRILAVDIAVITLGDMEGLRPIATRGLLLEDGFLLHPPSRPYLAKALESRRPVVGDGSEWDGAEQEMTGTHYIVPLVASGTTIGTLHIGVLEDAVTTSTAMGFSQVLDMAFLEALSAYAGAAIENTRLFEEVRDERLKLKTVVDYIPEGVILYTARGDVLAVNDSAREVAERDWINLNTDSRPYRMCDANGDPLRRVDWPFFRIQREAQPILGEVFVLDFGTHRKVVSSNVVPVPSVNNDSIPTYIGTLRDITLERERQTDRETFLQIVSHEMRSPLTPLTGFLQMVRKQAEAGETIDSELIRRAEHQVQRLARLIDRVLDLSRMQRIDLSLETIDLREVATSAGALWTSDPRGVRVDVLLPNHPVLANGDFDRLEQVLTNLVDNAVKHSDPDGVVEIEVVRTNGRSCLIVRDHGEGVPRADVPHIFNRFFTGTSGRSGLGIGLYVSRELVTAHGGEIRVASEPSVCTTFEVVLPSVSH